VYHKIRQLAWNRQTPRKIQLQKKPQEKLENLNKPIIIKQIELEFKKSSYKEKSRHRWLQEWIIVVFE
jgi:hypothetical protein